MKFVRRHPILVSIGVVVAIAFGLFFGTAVAVWKAAHTDEARKIAHVDAAVVLGAAQYNGTPSPAFQARLEQAMRLFHEGFTGRIVVLGGKLPGDLTTEGAAGRSWLISQGLPASAVYAVPEGNHTYESLRAAAAFMRAHHIRSVFLVSDPWHNLEIRRIGRDMGLDAYVSAVWQSQAQNRVYSYVRETLAYLHYRILHG